MELIPFENSIIPDWQRAVDITPLSPSPLGGPEYSATMQMSWGKTYIYRDGDLIIPLARGQLKFAKVLKSTLFAGMRFNSILGIEKIDTKMLDSLRNACGSCFIKLHIPEELYEGHRNILNDAGYLPENLYEYYKILLPESYEDWFNSPGINRKNINRATKSGVIVKMGKGELLDDFYNLYMKSFSRWKDKNLASHAHGIERFRRIFELPGSRAKIALAFHEDKPIASSIFGMYTKTAGAFISGMDYDYQKMRPADLIQAEIIRYLISQGIKEYNMGGRIGSKTLDLFKKKLGATVFKSYLVGRHRFPRLKKFFRSGK